MIYAHVKEYLDRSQDLAVALDGDESLEECRRNMDVRVDPNVPTRDILCTRLVEQLLGAKKEVCKARKALAVATKRVSVLEKRIQASEATPPGSPRRHVSAPQRSPSRQRQVSTPSVPGAPSPHNNTPRPPTPGSSRPPADAPPRREAITPGPNHSREDREKVQDMLSDVNVIW